MFVLAVAVDLVESSPGAAFLECVALKGCALFCGFVVFEAGLARASEGCTRPESGETRVPERHVDEERGRAGESGTQRRF